MDNIFKYIGAVGIILISLGIISKRRKVRDIYDILGGICLGIYSISIGNLIFIILQTIFTIVAVYDLIKTQFFTKNS
ncbi:MAG: hypothetical protein KAK00_09190 [Nanoarchaeota archaeon]|nr:hypothetical protein [Nanoarchaeota archaeon]